MARPVRARVRSGKVWELQAHFETLCSDFCGSLWADDENNLLDLVKEAQMTKVFHDHIQYLLQYAMVFSRVLNTNSYNLDS